MKIATKEHGNIKAIREFNNGLNEFYKHCLRYGTIINDRITEVHGEHYRGYSIMVDGLWCTIRMENGKVIEGSYELCDSLHVRILKERGLI